MKLTAQEIDQYIANEKKEVQYQREKIDELAANEKNLDIDHSRLDTKATLKYLTEAEHGAYANEAKSDPKLKEIIDRVWIYANMDVTAVNGDYGEERGLLMEIKKLLDDYMIEMDQKMLDKDLDDDSNKELEKEVFRKRYLVGANLQNFIDGQMNGSLVVDPGAVSINAVKIGCLPASDDWSWQMTDAKDMPLFPHDPSLNDISQGYLGDCYMVAGLSTLAVRFPNKIKDSMVDNGDGTVTVRFFKKKIDEETGIQLGHEPVFVTVDKKYPKIRGSQNCLWVQMLERAYAASGLHLAYGDTSPLPEDLQERYQELLEKKERGEKLPNHEDCPWLIDLDNNLKEWKPNYSMISSGFSNEFLEQFLGSDAPGELIGSGSEYTKESFIADINEKFGKTYQSLSGPIYTVVSHVIDTFKNPSESSDKSSMLDRMQKKTIDILNGIEQFRAKDAAMNEFVDTFLLRDPLFQSNKETIVQMINDGFDKWKGFIKYEENVPEYGGREKNIIQQIEKNLSQGNIVTTGTRGVSDTKNNRGILGRHAYSVLGITRHSLYEGGPELTFVRLRNPHGQTGCEYHVDLDKKEITRHSATLEETGGIFEIEIREFCNEFDHVGVNHVSPEMIEQERSIDQETKQRFIQLKQQEKWAKEELREGVITFHKLREMARPLRDAMKGLEETNGLFVSSSPEYDAFMKTMKETMMVKFGKGKWEGKIISGVSSDIGKIVKQGQAYLKHCKNNPRSGSRRETRVREVSRIVNCFEAYKEGMTPADYTRKKIAENLYEAGLEGQKAQPQKNVADPAVREKIIEGIMNSPIFKKITEEADFEKLSDMTMDSEKTYKLFVVTMKKQLEEKAAEDERQAAGAQHAKADVQQKEVEPQPLI